MNYWINSNTGDFIRENNGVYELVLISRFVEIEGKKEYLPGEVVKINEVQFKAIKGFLPIKAKKLANRNKNIYRPTIKGGVKGESKRVEIPTLVEIREQIINELLK
jgi:hypothetical protein